MNVGPGGQHPKSCAEQILARGDPGDRLDIDRVDGEQTSDHSGSPKRSGQPDEADEQKQGIDQVQGYVGPMMPPGMQVWELRVHGAIGPIVALLATRPVVDLDVQVPHLEEVLKSYYSNAASGVARTSDAAQ